MLLGNDGILPLHGPDGVPPLHGPDGGTPSLHRFLRPLSFPFNINVLY